MDACLLLSAQPGEWPRPRWESALASVNLISTVTGGLSQVHLRADRLGDCGRCQVGNQHWPSGLHNTWRCVHRHVMEQIILFSRFNTLCAVFSLLPTDVYTTEKLALWRLGAWFV